MSSLQQAEPSLESSRRMLVRPQAQRRGGSGSRPSCDRYDIRLRLARPHVPRLLGRSRVGPNPERCALKLREKTFVGRGADSERAGEGSADSGRLGFHGCLIPRDSNGQTSLPKCQQPETVSACLSLESRSRHIGLVLRERPRRPSRHRRVGIDASTVDPGSTVA